MTAVGQKIKAAIRLDIGWTQFGPEPRMNWVSTLRNHAPYTEPFIGGVGSKT